MTTGLYKKKPFIVEATHFDGSYEGLMSVVKWIETNSELKPTSRFVPGMDKFYLYITSCTGHQMQVNPSDYVIRGMQGEFYPVSEKIFVATYEKAGTK